VAQVLQVQSSEFKPQSHQKVKKFKFKKMYCLNLLQLSWGIFLKRFPTRFSNLMTEMLYYLLFLFIFYSTEQIIENILFINQFSF
jgi:hypothetical protein